MIARPAAGIAGGDEREPDRDADREEQVVEALVVGERPDDRRVGLGVDAEPAARPPAA